MASKILILFSTIFIQCAIIIPRPFGLLSLFPFWIYIVLSIIILTSSHKKLKKGSSKTISLFLVLLLVLIIGSFLHGYYHGSIKIGLMRFEIMQIITLSLFCMLVFRKHIFRTEDQIHSYIKYIISSAVLYVLINIILFILGFSNNPNLNNVDYFAENPAQMLSYFGMEQQRVSFLLSSGVNVFGVLAGAVLLIGLMLFYSKREKNISKLHSIIIICIGIYGILLVDSRSAIIIVIISFLISLTILNQYLEKFLRILPVTIPLFPFVLLFILSQFSDQIYSAGLLRNANNNEELLTLTNRTILWANTANELKTFNFHHLIGYGVYGQATSGISSNIIYDIGEHVTNMDQVSLHNTYLQYIIDTGYIGMTIFMILMIMVISKIINLHKYYANGYYDILFGLLVYFLFYGALEVSMNVYHDAFIFFLMIIIFIVKSPQKQYNSNYQIRI
jgi:O-antigen ligase